MSKLLFIFERDMPTVGITRNMYKNMKAYPEIKSDFVYLKDVTPSIIDSHDVLIFIRPMDVLSHKIASCARQAGHLVITHCDDDLLNLPKSVPSIPWRKRGLMKTLAQSDVISSSSPYILSKYCDLTAGKRTATTDTIVRPDELDGIGKSKSDAVRIVYAAASDHAPLFEKNISPIASRLAEEFGDKLSFTFINVHPDVKGVKCSYLNTMPLMEFRKFMKEQNFEIGVAPLNNDDFSKCKYFNKFIEYTTQGTVGVYSNVEPYTYVIKDKNNGFLAEDNPESWYTALSTAIKQKELREKCLSNAIEYLREHHSEEACMDRILSGIPEYLGPNKSYPECAGFSIQIIKYYLTKPLDWIYLVWYYFRKTGIIGLVKRIKTHFTENKAYNKGRER